MEPLFVLIVEDEPLIAMQIEEIVGDAVPSTIIVTSSIQETNKIVDKPFDLALLDIDVTNGKTYDIARHLARRQVPFVFLSGSNRRDLPEELQSAQFIQKPFERSQIKNIVLAVDGYRRDATL